MLLGWGGGAGFLLPRSLHPGDDCVHTDISGSPAAESVRWKMRILSVTESVALKGVCSVALTQEALASTSSFNLGQRLGLMAQWELWARLKKKKKNQSDTLFVPLGLTDMS